MKVLAADDDAVTRKVLEARLKSLGCSVVLAEGGEKALAALGGEPFDLALLDCQMPGLDGLEAAERWRRAEPAASRVALIAMSASELEPEKKFELAGVVDGFLLKPAGAAELQVLLKRWAGPLDEAALAGLAKVKAGLDAQVAALFLKDAPLRMAELSAAARAGDACGMAAAAHALRGACGNVGALRLESVCRRIEVLAGGGDAAGAAALLDAARVQHEKAASALRARRGA